MIYKLDEIVRAANVSHELGHCIGDVVTSCDAEKAGTLRKLDWPTASAIAGWLLVNQTLWAPDDPRFWLIINKYGVPVYNALRQYDDAKRAKKLIAAPGIAISDARYVLPIALTGADDIGVYDINEHRSIIVECVPPACVGVSFNFAQALDALMGSDK